MRLCHRAVVAGLASAGLLLALAPAGAATPGQDAAAAVVRAQLALQRGDCGRASSAYAGAAQQLADVRLAVRATGLALDCGQYATATRAAARWRALAPDDPQALHAQICVALGQFHIAAARTAFRQWLAAGAKPTNTAIVSEIAALAQQAGVSATFALLRGLDLPALSGAAVQLALAQLAYEDWNYQATLRYARAPAAAGSAAAQRGEAQALMAHAYAGLAQTDAAVAAANAARAASPDQQSFVLADVWLILGRDADARRSLESLRDDPKLHVQAERRLGLMALDSGDDTGAEQIFNDLLSDRDSSAVALFYLGAIAERRDDTATALRAYGLLDGTALAPQARERMARILYRQDQHAEALRLLRSADDASIAARLQAEEAQAQLLASVGAAADGLTRIDDALERFPAHPDLRYQQAILLERSGRTAAAIKALAALYDTRSDDPQVGNALGFLLADHDRELARAQRLISAALQAEPDNPAILDSMGWLQFRRGAARAALPLLERAYRLDADGDIGAHWGQVLWSLGQKSQARSVWVRALLADPDNDSVKAALKRAGQALPVNTGAGQSV